MKKSDKEIVINCSEMKKIFSDRKLLKKLKKGHSFAKQKKGKLIG